MKISSKGRYAVRVMADIATADKEYVSISDIALRQAIPAKYLEQIISKLVKAKLLVSSRGAMGGYRLTKNPKEYKMSEILGVTGDMPELVPCQDRDCPRKDSCASVSCFETLNKLICDYLDSVSLQDLIDKTHKI